MLPTGDVLMKYCDLVVLKPSFDIFMQILAQDNVILTNINIAYQRGGNTGCTTTGDLLKCTGV